jgi:hypothetical protein
VCLVIAYDLLFCFFCCRHKTRLKTVSPCSQ